MSNKDWWPISNKLALKESYAMANGDTAPFKLIVEGRIDNFFYTRIVNEKVEIISVGKSIRPKPSNVRKAIIGLMEELRNNPNQFKHILPLAVVDSDYDNSDPDESNLVHTDTNDLETLLLSTGAFDISCFPGMTNSIKKTVECVSYQFGHIRKALFKYIDQKKLNIRDFINEEWLADNFKLFCDVKNGINVNTLFLELSKLPDNRLYKNEIGLELLMNFVFARLRDDSEVDIKNNLIRHPSSFDKNAVSSYWDVIRGHDVGNIVANLIPNLKQNLIDNYQIFNLDSFIASRSDPQRIKNTKLFKTFSSWGIS